MRFLLTNDDGIEAPGLRTLERVADELNASFVTVAPDAPLSGCSHQVTTDRPLQCLPAGTNRYSVNGTTADCTRVALTHLGLDIDWVLSGINDGGNLGVDIYMSGTVAGAREAALFDIPAIALSQFRRSRAPSDWEHARQMALKTLQHLMDEPLPDRAFWNVNLPDVDVAQALPDIVHCPLDNNPLPTAFDHLDGNLFYRGNYQQRKRAPGSDVHTCFDGKIALTQIRL